MAAIPFALYDAFSETAFGGSQAAIVSDAASLDASVMRQIVREMGLPAVGFVTETCERAIAAQFRSTVMELPMCGHGTIALMTRMVELGVLTWNGSDRIDVELCLASAGAAVEITRRDDGRPLVMLDVRMPDFRTDAVDTARLARLLGLTPDGFSAEWPIETAVGDFVHLVVPVKDLAAMRMIAPDFGGVVEICRDHGIETVAAFCTEVERPGSRLHVRDFCPAVGVAESAAAGTTNAALTGYLIRHGIVRPNGDGRVSILAEQGHEICRPSTIRTVADLDGDTIVRLQVGGVATKVADGLLHF
jgi:PhzF family phenazine biosynthesis protein